MLEPEALGVREVLEHAERRPPARHNGLPERCLVEAFDDREDALSLRSQEFR
jgi:hypothetical protein